MGSLSLVGVSTLTWHGPLSRNRLGLSYALVTCCLATWVSSRSSRLIVVFIAHRKHAYVPTIIGVIPFCRPNGTCNPLLYLSKEAEMELTFLNAEVTTLSAQYFRVINYTNLMNQPETYARPISRFLRLSHQSEDHLTTRLRTGITKNHTSRPTPPDTSLDFLDDFLPSDEINSGAFLVGMRSTLRLSIDWILPARARANLTTIVHYWPFSSML